MAKKERGQIIETETQARSVLLLLVISTSLAVLTLGGVWSAFFRT